MAGSNLVILTIFHSTQTMIYATRNTTARPAVLPVVGGEIMSYKQCSQMWIIKSVSV